MSRIRIAGLLFAVLVCPAEAWAGPIWPEGAAGRLPATAEPVTVPFTRITGTLSGTFLRGVESGDFEDMYQIRILDEPQCGGKGFSASTEWMVTPGGANDFNTQLWLFDANGFGLLGNDDAAPGVPQSYISFPATDITLQPFPGPGIYYLAISGFNDDPLSFGGPIFNQANPTEISGPDGPGGLFQINNWTSNGSSAIGKYDILLQCAAPVPEPTVSAVLLLSLVVVSRRPRTMAR